MKKLRSLTLAFLYSFSVTLSFSTFLSRSVDADEKELFVLNENLFPIDCGGYQGKLTQDNPSDDFLIQGEPEVLSLIEFRSPNFSAKLKKETSFYPEIKEDKKYNLDVKFFGIPLLKVYRESAQGTSFTKTTSTEVGNYLSGSYFGRFTQGMSQRMTHINLSSHSGQGGTYFLQTAAAEPSSDISIDTLESELGFENNFLNYVETLKNSSISDLLNRNRLRFQNQNEAKTKRRKYAKMICDSYDSNNYNAGNHVYFENRCRYPVDIAISYKIPSRYNSKELSIWKVEGWWSFDGGKSSYLSVNEQRVASNNGIFYLYGVVMHDAHRDYSWSGDTNMIFNDRQLPMRQIESTSNDKGDHIIQIHCNNI